MKVEIIIGLYTVFYFVKIQAKDTCLFYTPNGNTSTTICSDDCCSTIAMSLQTACCSHLSLSTLAIPFFVIAGICIVGICLIYCRPLWKMCLCGHKCPCESRSRVNSPRPEQANENPVFVINNDDLPDYETTIKDSTMKDTTPPPYNFVTTHPNDFGIESRVPSAPPQYHSRRGSLMSTTNDNPTN